MSESPDKNEAEDAGKIPVAERHENAPEHSEYLYASAGITERKGDVPFWLWIVAFSLLIWGIEYLIIYWNAPALTP